MYVKNPAAGAAFVVAGNCLDCIFGARVKPARLRELLALPQSWAGGGWFVTQAADRT